MAKWEVWNNHKDGLTHKEDYKGDKLVIPAGKYILMDYEEAVQFKSQYFPMKKDGMDRQTPESMKMISLRKHVTGEDEDKDANKFISHIDGKEFSTQAELDTYVKANFDGQQIVDEVAEESIKETKRGRSRKG